MSFFPWPTVKSETSSLYSLKCLNNFVGCNRPFHGIITEFMQKHLSSKEKRRGIRDRGMKETTHVRDTSSVQGIGLRETKENAVKDILAATATSLNHAGWLKMFTASFCRKHPNAHLKTLVI